MLEELRTLSLSIFQNSEFLILVFLCALILLGMHFIKPFLPDHVQEEMPAVTEGPLSFLRPGAPAVRLSRQDWYILLTVILLYGTVSFYRLGSHTMPETTWQPSASPQTVVFELTGETRFNRVIGFYGEGDNNSRAYDYQLGFHDILLDGSNDLTSWEPITVLDGSSIYRYFNYDGAWDYRYIRLTSQNDADTITELAFADSWARRLLPVRVLEDPMAEGSYPASLIIDEQEKVALDPSYYDESYFDEVYHPRNAWEIVHQQAMYSTVHPLLGTEFIALSIRLFGMNPFAWRLPGVLFGIAMLGVLFHLLCLLFEDHRYAWLGTILFAAEFMHITTSRIATLEPMSVFFILLMFDRMVLYSRMSFYDVPLHKTIRVLFLCGIDMSLAISVKWTGCYSAVGLAVLFFYVLYLRFQEYRMAKEIPPETAVLFDEASRRHYERVLRFWEYALKTVLWAVLFFVIIPVIIYCLVYIPAPFSRSGWSLQAVAEQTRYIYQYHINLDATHPYQSDWYQWLLDLRPIWYYGRSDQNGIYHTIACFTNPAVTIGGLIALPVTVYHALRHQSLPAIAISAGFLSAFLPWMLVDRCVFAYHFYPSSVFMILAIVFAFSVYEQKRPDSVVPLMQAYAALTIFLFIIYLPVLTGLGTRLAYVHLLEVIPSWYFG